MADVSYDTDTVTLAVGEVVEAGTADEDIDAGQCIYADASDSSLLKLIDTSSAEAPAATDAFGLAISSGKAGQTIAWVKRSEMITYGTETDPQLVQGTIYVASANNGNIKPADEIASGESLIVIGYATSDMDLAMLLKRSGVVLD